MADWLQPLLMMFYAPTRGMREVRDRAPLGFSVLLALLSYVAFTLSAQWLAGGLAVRRVSLALVVMLVAWLSRLMIIALVFVPALAFVANLLDRRGSFGVVVRQEYAALCSTVFYALAAAHVGAIVLAFLAHISGVQEAYVLSSMEGAGQVQEWFKSSPELQAQLQAQLSDPRFIAENLFRTIKLGLFAFWTVFAVREVFRLSVPRALATLVLSLILVLLTGRIWGILFSTVLASPLLVLLLFFLLRGYIGELSKNARARVAFKQNLEAATLNPADASAHYNLGLIYQQRQEFEKARASFERAVEIDSEEVDAHYQLGRIARTEGRLPDAIKHFEQVVSRDQTHAQHEIWRETGATYLAAGQFEDARSSLERFLDERQSDPEGLYLMGRALAGLGHRREAAAAMQACIEAVKTSPAYKYRTEKRWLNEAQQFLRSQV